MDYWWAVILGAAGGAEQPIDGQTGVWWYSSGALVSSGMSITGGVLSRGDVMDVYSRGVASDVTLRNYGSLTVRSGGVTVGIVEYGGYHKYLPGAMMSDAILRGANVTVSGAIIEGLTMSGGVAYISGGSANHVTLSGNANFVAYELGKPNYLQMTNVTVRSAAKLQVRENASASGVTVSGGGQVSCWYGGKTYNAEILSGGFMLVSGVGWASGVTVASGGSLTISSGASALAVTSNAGAVVTVIAGGYIEYVNS